MSATQQIINKLNANNVKILQTAPPEGVDPNQFQADAFQAMTENNRKIGILSRQLNGK